jgi:putative selenate reductase
VFEKDLEYGKAVGLIRSLQGAAQARGLTFGVKLSNTLAMHNHRGMLPGDEMYMSGRALYPITMNLFARLMAEFDGGLRVSYSAGADALNVATILSCGARTVTACTDLLKPGGYARFGQWLENLDAEMAARGAASLDELAAGKLANVEQAAAEALADPRYKKHYFPYGLPKVKSGLGLWDCVVAPCVEACAVEQDVPEYAWLIAKGEYDRALEVILARNPLPGVTGYVCTHLCQTRCTRNDYEEPVAIRALKRIAAEKGKAGYPAAETRRRGKVAIIGSGPSGLSAAAFLALNGVQATIFEAKDVPGGMMRVVPPFRLPWAIIQEDINRITALGVELKLNHPVRVAPEELLKEGYDAVYVASGFQRDAPLQIEGIEGPGVMPALQLLDRSRRGASAEALRADLGRKAVVIGGGDTAMDAARTAQRFTGHPATILYRRTRHEMPAAEEELEAVVEEGNILVELATPVRVVRHPSNGKAVALECLRNRLGEPGPDGRREPLPISGSEFTVETDSVIVAVGQLPELTFLDGSSVTRHRGGGIIVDPQTGCAGPEGVYAGGDVVIKPGSIIDACADGRRAAEAICDKLCIPFEQPAATPAVLSEDEVVEVKRARARKEAQRRPAMIPLVERTGFRLIESTLTEEAARAEGLRCFQCTTFCDKCVEVCPNRANLTFLIPPVDAAVPQIACRPVEAAGELRLEQIGTEQVRVAQSRQILHVDDLCNECDDCATFCVHQGRPYADKPRLFLDREVFERESDNAFHIEGDTILRREGGRDSRLSLHDGAALFENAHVRVELSPDYSVREMVLKEEFEGTFSLKQAIEMVVILKGVRVSLPFLLSESR